MRAVWVFLIICAATAGWFGGSASIRSAQSVNDVSWPQCGMNLGRAESGIVGVTGGLALRPNPCLNQEAARYKKLSVYINTGYPGPRVASKFQTHGPKDCSNSDKVCRAYNYGYSNSTFSVRYALMSGVIAKRWWLDVETENSWDDDVLVNRAAIQGGVDALTSFVGRDNVGVYSLPGQWNLITGNWRNYLDAWVATGSSRKEAAEQACKAPSFSGGSVVLSQYTPSLDVDLVCD